MKLETIRQLLDRLPDRTDYEFKNFEMESFGSWHRQARAAMLQFEDLSHQIQTLEAEMDLADHQLQVKKATVVDEEFEILARISESKTNGMRRQLKKLTQRRDQVDAWLSQYGQRELEDMVDTYESSESDSWSELLGRDMGVQLLADNHAHYDTMAKLALLPLSDYKKSVLITNQFANFLRKTAENVEKTFEQNRPQGLSSDSDS